MTGADGEQTEEQHWLKLSVDYGYSSRERVEPLPEQCHKIGKMPGSMIAQAARFCKPDTLSIHEEQALYFTCSTRTDH